MILKRVITFHVMNHPVLEDEVRIYASFADLLLHG